MRAILHIGAAKCGTTATQTALGGLRSQLEAAGLHYPMGYGTTEKSPRTGALIHGNAVALGWLLDPNLNNPNFDRPAVDAWLQDCIAEAAGRDLLFSSEIMQMPHHPHASDLANIFARAGYDVHIVYYARHAMDQSIAVYLQVLKRGRLAELGYGSLDDFVLRHATCPYEAALAAFRRVLPADRFMVRHFDTVRGNLVADFLKLITPYQFDMPPKERVINRSPTPAEQVVFAALTQQDGGARLCRMTSDLLMSEPLKAPIEHSVSPAAYSAYVERNQGIVDRMNAEYPSLGGGLRVKSQHIHIGEAAAPPADEIIKIFTRCIAHFTEKWAGGARKAQAPRAAALEPAGPEFHALIEQTGLLPPGAPA